MGIKKVRIIPINQEPAIATIDPVKRLARKIKKFPLPFATPFYILVVSLARLPDNAPAEFYG